MTDDQAAHGGRDGDIERLILDESADFFREAAAEALGVRRHGQDLRALQVFAAMQAAGESEVALQVGSGLLK